VGWKPRGDLCLFAMQGMLMLLNVSKRIKNLRIDNIFRKGWKERLLRNAKLGMDSSSSLWLEQVMMRSYFSVSYIVLLGQGSSGRH